MRWSGALAIFLAWLRISVSAAAGSPKKKNDEVLAASLDEVERDLNGNGPATGGACRVLFPDFFGASENAVKTQI